MWCDVKIHIKVFLVMMLCSVAVEYQCFRGSWCLHLHLLVPLKCWYPIASLQGDTTQKTSWCVIKTIIYVYTIKTLILVPLNYITLLKCERSIFISSWLNLKKIILEYWYLSNRQVIEVANHIYSFILTKSWT